MTHGTRRAGPLILGGLLIVSGCMAGAVAPAPPSAAGTTESTAADVRTPSGHGTLRQDDITVELVAGSVRLRLTPLAPTLIRLTAPDTELRLAALLARVESGEGLWFLASVQSDAPGGAEFDPMDVEVSSGGRMERAEQVHGLTPEWGSGRLEQRVPQQALYRFSADVDPWRALEVGFGDRRTTAWTDRLPRLDAERARVRARAGGYWSSPNFLILR